MREKPPYLRLVSSEPQFEAKNSLRERLEWRGITLKDIAIAVIVSSAYLFAGALLLFGIFGL
tara:strand:+ start:622 stop:807 length:186 start_codon:yes stop_codon:yes gene_type:complete